MRKGYAEDRENSDNIERLRMNLHKYSDLIIQNIITEEILLVSMELDECIVKFYKKGVSDNNIA